MNFLHTRTTAIIWIIVGLLLVAIASADPVAPEVTLNLSQTTRTDGKVDVRLSWSTNPVADGCVATGGWTGTRAASRSADNPVVFLGVTPPKDYTLTCRKDDKDVHLTWVPPTENEDGSALTNLQGYRIYYSTNLAHLEATPIDPAAIVVTLGNAVSEHDIGSLAAGVYYFTMTAFHTQESAKSAIVQATLGSATDAATQTATAAIPAPKAPTGLVVEP